MELKRERESKGLVFGLRQLSRSKGGASSRPNGVLLFVKYLKACGFTSSICIYNPTEIYMHGLLAHLFFSPLSSPERQEKRTRLFSSLIPYLDMTLEKQGRFSQTGPWWCDIREPRESIWGLAIQTFSACMCHLVL